MDVTSEPPSIDSADIAWERVETATYLVSQRFQYQYPARILDLQHQLVVVPPQRFGNQARIMYSLRVSEPGEVITRTDSFANTVLDVRIPAVERGIDFETAVTLERHAPLRPRSLAGAWLHDSRLLDATPRTMPDRAIERAADNLLATGARGIDLARLANRWVFDTMTYSPGATGIHTTAAAALADRQGVCQDYAHLMIAICRRLGLAVLYVSGHLLGQGGTHAWVEVILPSSDGGDRAECWPLDPTHGQSADLTYLTVAVGREYGDVAPTSGSYRAEHGGTLMAHKDVRVVGVVYADDRTRTRVDG